MPDRLVYRPFGAFRFLLAFLVLVKHFCADVAPDWLAEVTRPYAFGYVAVLVFFILSGFVITEAVYHFYRHRPVGFIENRLLRIVPHYFLALAAMIVVCLVFSDAGSLRVSRTETLPVGEAFEARNLLANLFGFVPFSNQMMDFDFIGIAWAIRVEMMFYLFFSAALWLERVAGRLFDRRLLTGILCLIVLALCPLWFLSMAGRLPAMISLAPYFIFGSALYFLLRSRSRESILMAFLAFAGCAAQFAVYSVHGREPGTEGGAWVEFTLLVGLVGAIIWLAESRLTRLRSLDEALGRVTYPLYVFHPVVEVFILSLVPGYSYWAFVIGIALSVAVSCLLQALIDPTVDRIRDGVRGSRTGIGGSKGTDPFGGIIGAEPRHSPGRRPGPAEGVTRSGSRI